jgi:small-conductance mechanosensitive channel
MLAQGGIWASRALAAWFERRFRDVRAQDPDGATTLRLIGFAAQGAVWLLVGLLALDQLGFDVTALIAGLGIGGVALALAVQNILGDVFACAAIALDKPFVVGDFIVVDGLRGTVENVGLKTTRVRSLHGELLIFSNADLLKSRVRNFKRMFERRIQFSIAVTYDTPADELRRIPGWLREAVDAQPKTRFDRAHFKAYGDWALEFEVVYYVVDPDYNVYMDVQQGLNLAIYERFAAEGVQFAFPTQTLLVREVKRALRPALADYVSEKSATRSTG